MAKPTWEGWPDVIAAQRTDVTTPGPKYQGIWENDYRDWIPEVYDTGITWNYVSPEVKGDVDFDMTLEQELSSIRHLWEPVGEEITTWQEVPYPK